MSGMKAQIINDSTYMLPRIVKFIDTEHGMLVTRG